MSNITGGKHFKRQKEEVITLERNFLDEEDFKKFSDLNFSGGFPLGELRIICAPTSIDKSQIMRASAIICHEVPIYNFNEKETK